MAAAPRRCSRSAGIRYEIARDVGPPRPRDGRRLLQERAHARAEGHHRRRRPVAPRCPAWPPRTPTCRSSASRCRAACRPPAGSTRCCRSPRCRRACRSPAWAWTTPRTPGTWRCASCAPSAMIPATPGPRSGPSGPTRPSSRAGAQVEVACARGDRRARRPPTSRRSAHATFTVEAVHEREKVTDHDVAAFVDVLSAQRRARPAAGSTTA